MARPRTQDVPPLVRAQAVWTHGEGRHNDARHDRTDCARTDDLSSYRGPPVGPSQRARAAARRTSPTHQPEQKVRSECALEDASFQAPPTIISILAVSAEITLMGVGHLARLAGE